MNVTISGYASFTCSNCGAPHTFEKQAFRFVEDRSPTGDDDSFIRYTAQIAAPCSSCQNQMLIQFDVWEHPEAVVNYSYYGEQGASQIQCEFNIEHYFDGDAVKEEDLDYDEEEELQNPAADENDHDLDDEENPLDEPSEIERFMDRYDDDE